MTKNVLTPIEVRFWQKVEKTVGGCWLWTGGKTTHGYGMLGNGRRGSGVSYAHRVSFQLHKGPVPDGLLVLHKCNVFACVNPDHLYAGSYGDNIRQAWADGLRK